jgi:glycosyltransferase involved in cell wall biosynthesis
VPPGDAAALAAALRRAITDPDLRAALAAGSRRAGAALPGWDDTAAALAAVLRKAGA